MKKVTDTSPEKSASEGAPPAAATKVVVSGRLSKKTYPSASKQLSASPRTTPLTLRFERRHGAGTIPTEQHPHFPLFLSVLSQPTALEVQGDTVLAGLVTRCGRVREALGGSAITAVAVEGAGYGEAEWAGLWEGLAGMPTLTRLAVTGARLGDKGSAVLARLGECLFAPGARARISRLELRGNDISTNGADLLADALVAARGRGALSHLKVLDLTANPIKAVEGNLLELLTKVDGLTVEVDLGSLSPAADRAMFLASAAKKEALYCDGALSWEDLLTLSRAGTKWTSVNVVVLPDFTGGEALAAALVALLESQAGSLSSLRLDLEGAYKMASNVSPEMLVRLSKGFAAAGKVTLYGKWDSVFPGLAGHLMEHIISGAHACKSLMFEDLVSLTVTEARNIASLSATVVKGKFPGDLSQLLGNVRLGSFSLTFSDWSWSAWAPGGRSSALFGGVMTVIGPENRSRTDISISIQLKTRAVGMKKSVDFQAPLLASAHTFSIKIKTFHMRATLSKSRYAGGIKVYIETSDMPKEALSIIGCGIPITELSLGSQVHFGADLLPQLGAEILRSGASKVELHGWNPERMMRAVILPGPGPLRSLMIGLNTIPPSVFDQIESNESLNEIVRSNEKTRLTYPAEKNYRLLGIPRNERMRSQIASLLSGAPPVEISPDAMAAVGLAIRRARVRSDFRYH